MRLLFCDLAYQELFLFFLVRSHICTGETHTAQKGSGVVWIATHMAQVWPQIALLKTNAKKAELNEGPLSLLSAKDGR